jgi:hypothetical protein
MVKKYYFNFFRSLMRFDIFFRIISDKDNTIVIGEAARQFRMKLPNTDFVALVAVGVR